MVVSSVRPSVCISVCLVAPIQLSIFQDYLHRWIVIQFSWTILLQELQAATDSLANREEAYQHQQLLLNGETQKVTKKLENVQLELTQKVTS